MRTLLIAAAAALLGTGPFTGPKPVEFTQAHACIEQASAEFIAEVTVGSLSRGEASFTITQVYPPGTPPPCQQKSFRTKKVEVLWQKEVDRPTSVVHVSVVKANEDDSGGYPFVVAVTVVDKL